MSPLARARSRASTACSVIAVAMGHGAEQSIAVDGVTGQTREDLVKLL